MTANSPAYNELFQFCQVKIGDTVECRPFVLGEMGFNAYDCSYDDAFTGVVMSIDSGGACYLVNSSHSSNIIVPFFAIAVIQQKINHEVAQKAFVAFHKASGFKIGDKVRITRQAVYGELGWSDCWERSDSVGKIGEIIEDYFGKGWIVHFSGEYSDIFPDFVLQKVIDEKTVNIKPHNPFNLSPEKIGNAKGYRLLDEDEIKHRENLSTQIEMLAHLYIEPSYWCKGVDGYFGNNVGCCYRTKLSREELAKLI